MLGSKYFLISETSSFLVSSSKWTVSSGRIGRRIVVSQTSRWYLSFVARTVMKVSLCFSAKSRQVSRNFLIGATDQPRHMTMRGSSPLGAATYSSGIPMLRLLARIRRTRKTLRSRMNQVVPKVGRYWIGTFFS